MPRQTIKLRGLGAKGVVSDISPQDLEINAWTDATNIRFTNGRAEKIGGYIPVFYNNRKNQLHEERPQVPMHLEAMPQTTEEWIYCTSNAIWVTDGWDHQLKSPDPYIVDVDGTTAPFVIDVVLEAPWSSAVVSNSVVLNSVRIAKPLGLLKSDSKFKPLANWGSGTEWNITTIRAFKNFVMAVGGGDEYPQRVRWSNIVPPNALPADWGWQYEYSKQDQDANPDHIEGYPIPAGDPLYGKFINGSAGGYNDLSFAVGNIVDGRALRDQFIIYTDSEVISCDYVGGNDIFRFRSLFDDGGAINPDCIASFENKHFVVSTHDVYIHNGSTKESVIDNKIRVKLLSELTTNSPSSIKVVPYLPENEVWVLYAGPDAQGLQDSAVVGSDRLEATRAAVFNYKFGTWTFIEIPRTLDIKLGPIPIYNENHQKTNTWDKQGEIDWEESLELWNLVGGGSSHNFKDQSLLCASNDGGFYALDRGDFIVNLGEKNETTGVYKLVRSEIASSLYKTFIDLDEITNTPDYKTLLEMWPQVEGTGEFSIQIGGAQVPGGLIDWGETLKYVCGVTRKVDLRQNHRYLCLNISSQTAGTWSLSGIDAVLRIGGSR